MLLLLRVLLQTYAHAEQQLFRPQNRADNNNTACWVRSEAHSCVSQNFLFVLGLFHLW